MADDEASGFAAKTDVKKSLISKPSSTNSTKKRSVPAAALGLLRRRDLHIHNFFQRHSAKNNNNSNNNKEEKNSKNIPILSYNEQKSTIFNCAISDASPCETNRANTPSSTRFSCTTTATTSNQPELHQHSIGGENSSNSNSDDEVDNQQQRILPLATIPSSNTRFAPRSVRRLVATPFSISGSGRNTGQMPSSSSTHHHLAAVGQSHARRESFLYRADDREPLYNPASLLGYRPVSRASSVASSDPQ